MRRRLDPVVQTGTVACVRCGELIEPNTPWHLDHRDDGRGWLGPSHARWQDGLAWPQKPEPKQPSSESAEEAAAKDPIFAEYRRRTAGIEDHDDWGSGNKWVDADKLANLVVGVFDTPADAHVAFLASNDLSRAYGAKYGFVVKAEKVDGLGDEAWRLWAHGNGRQVTYHWRRDNLGVEVHVHCYGDVRARHGCQRRRRRLERGQTPSTRKHAPQAASPARPPRARLRETRRDPGASGGPRTPAAVSSTDA